jgi:hypothetical protein
MPKRKISGAADYIIPLGVLGLGVLILYKLGVFGGSSSGPGLSLPGNTNVTPTSPAGQAAIATLTAVEQWDTGNPGNFLYADMYNANPDDAYIDQTDATSLYSDVWAASDPGIFIHNPDFSGVLANFQATVKNQTDISFVSATMFAAQGVDLATCLAQNFYTAKVGTSGKSQIQMAWDFINYGISLPASS